MNWSKKLREFFRKPGIDAADDDSIRRAERPLQILVVASVVLPLLVFATASWIAYGHTVDEARGRLQRTLGHVSEHAAKVFETFDLSARYTEELFGDASDDEIQAKEAEYNERLRTLVKSLPQLRDIWIVSADGRPLVSGTVFPMPRNLDLSDREYFTVHLRTPSPRVYISEVLDARAADLRFFSATQKREPAADGRFRGLVVISAAPEYFTQYYAALPTQAEETVGLLRRDGAILAWHPKLPPERNRLGVQSALLRAIQTSDASVLTSISPIDETDRLYSFRKLPYHDLYVVAGIPWTSIGSEWLATMGKHLIFGLPATVALLALSLIALRRTRREAIAYAQLRSEVARRESAELTMRQVQKMEAIGRLTGGIAHDFNNLLTAILGNVDLALLRLDSKEGRVQRYLTSAHDASRRAATLVSRLLAFSRQHPLEAKVIDVNRVVQNMSELLRRTIPETITIETVLGGGLWRAALDANQLENAILNLAVNARDAMPDGGRLTIETSNSYLDELYVGALADGLKAGQYVMLAVTDTGAGMHREVVERAFEPFFTTKPPGVGTGLGLSTVYGFVKQSGGHVKIYSELDEGTTVKLYFPRTTALETELTVEPSTQRLPTGGQPNEVILLVEDDVEVNRFASEILTDLGYQVHSAADGAGALKLLEEIGKIDLLFTDVVLPGGMNGRELARKVQQTRPALKVLYATGYTRNAIIHQGRLDPDVELLTKPFTYEVLARKIRQVLDGAPATGAEEPAQA